MFPRMSVGACQGSRFRRHCKGGGGGGRGWAGPLAVARGCGVEPLKYTISQDVRRGRGWCWDGRGRLRRPRPCSSRSNGKLPFYGTTLMNVDNGRGKGRGISSCRDKGRMGGWVGALCLSSCDLRDSLGHHETPTESHCD